MNFPKTLTALALILAALGTNSCSHPTYGLDYSYQELPPQGPTHPLPKGKTPLVLYAMDPAALTKRYEAAGYAVIGAVETIQTLIPFGAVAAFAESKGASLVITSNYYERTDEETRIRPVTESYTTYHSGSISPSYNFYPAGGGVLASPPSYSYSGSSTTYHTRMVEYKVPVAKYAQYFFFLAPKA